MTLSDDVPEGSADGTSVLLIHNGGEGKPSQYKNVLVIVACPPQTGPGVVLE